MTTIKHIFFPRQVSPPPSIGGIFGVVNPDYEQRWREEDVKDPRNIYHVSRPTRNGTAYWAKSKTGDPIGFGAPATARFLYHPTFEGSEYTDFTDDFQTFIHELSSANSGQSEAENKKSFASLFRDNVMMTDYAGTWTRYDHINKNGMPRYIAIKAMVNGGSLVKIIGEMKFGGTDHWLVEGMTNKNFSQYHPTTHKWLFFRPVISIRQWHFDAKGNVLKKEEHYAEPFPQYNMNSILPILGMKRDDRSSTGWASAIPKFRVRVLKSGESVPNPFIMRYGRVRPNPYQGFIAP